MEFKEVLKNRYSCKKFSGGRRRGGQLLDQLF